MLPMSSLGFQKGLPSHSPRIGSSCNCLTCQFPARLAFQMEIYGNSRNSLSQKSRKSLILLIINDGNIYKACGVTEGLSHFQAFIWHSVSAVPLIKVTIQSLPLGADSPVTWYQVTPPTHSANCSAIHHFYNLRVMHNKSQVNNK